MSDLSAQAKRGQLGAFLMLAALTLALATQLAISTDFGFDRIGVGFLIAVLLFVTGAALAPRGEGALPKIPFRAELMLLGGILLLAAFLRVWKVWDFPPGLWFDEIMYGFDAIEILEQDHFTVWSTKINGRPTLFMYLLAGVFQLFGVSELSMRALPITIGVITVGAFYLLARELLGQTAGLIATFFLAVSRWQITFSRIVWEASMMPLMVILSLYFLLKALRTGRWYYYAAAGLSVGAGLYTYLAFRLMPIVLIILVGYIAWRRWPLIRRNLLGLVGAAVVSIVVFLPLGWYAVRHQEEFFIRANQVDIRDEIWNGGDIDIDPLWSNVRKVAVMFNARGDANGRHNYQSNPMLDEISGALLVIGAGVSLAAWRNWREGSLLLLAGLFAVPSIFTLTFENPSAIRTLGMVPPLFLMIGLGMRRLLEAGWFWLGRWFFVAPLLVVLLVPSAVINYRDLFEGHAKDPIIFHPGGGFMPQPTIVAERVAAEADDHLIIISASFAREYALALLVRDVPKTIYDAEQHIPLQIAPEQDVIYILDPSEAETVRLLLRHYPEGAAEEVRDPFGGLIYVTFEVAREAVASTIEE